MEKLVEHNKDVDVVSTSVVNADPMETTHTCIPNLQKTIITSMNDV
jgi:hypothetical protein